MNKYAAATTVPSLLPTMSSTTVKQLAYGLLGWEVLTVVALFAKFAG